MKLFIVLFSICLFFGNPLNAQDTQVPVWGLYLDFQDPLARRMAANLAGVGYSAHPQFFYNTAYNMMVMGDLLPLTKALKRKRRDGLTVQYESISAGPCDTLVIRDTLIRFRDIRLNVIDQYNNQIPDHLPEKFNKLSEEVRQEHIEQQQKNFRKFLRGKGRALYVEDMVWTPFQVLAPEPDEKISYRFFQKRDEKVSLIFDTLQGEFANRFKAFKESECEPFDRLTYVKALTREKPESYSQHYTPRGQVGRTYTLELSFAQGSSVHDPIKLQPLFQLMENENLSIYSARVEGFASVEGTPEINQALMEKRARVLVKALSKMNDENIELDTVITNESWTQFYRQIAGTHYSYLAQKDKEEIRKTLNENDQIRTELEPMLCQQRTARISLSMAERLDDAQKLNVALNNLQSTLIYICTDRKPPVNINMEARFMSVLDYLEKKIEEGELAKERVLELLECSERVKDLLYRKLYADYYNGNGLSSVFDPLTVINEAQEYYQRAYEAHIQRPGQLYAGLKTGDFLQNRLSGIQYLVHELIQKDMISVQAYSILSYPDAEEYYGLILNMLHVVPETGVSAKHTSEEKTSSSVMEVQPLASGNDVNTESTPSYSYYYLLKKIIFEGSSKVRRYVYRTDYLYYFDMYEFLLPNVQRWDEKQDTYFDKDIDRRMMRKYLKKLNDSRICAETLQQLNLDYHLKELNYYLYHGVANEIDERDLLESFRLIRNYYLYHVSQANTETLWLVTKQLALVNQLFMSRDGTEAAYQLLKAAEKYHDYEGEMNKWFLQLGYYHDRSFPIRMRKLDQPSFCDFYSGEYALIPYKEMLKRYCEECTH